MDEHPHPTGLHRALVASITGLTVPCHKRGRRTRVDDCGPGRAELVQEMQEEGMGTLPRQTPPALLCAMGEQRCVNTLQVSVLGIPTVPADCDPLEPSALSALPLPHVSRTVWTGQGQPSTKRSRRISAGVLLLHPTLPPPAQCASDTW